MRDGEPRPVLAPARGRGLVRTHPVHQAKRQRELRRDGALGLGEPAVERGQALAVARLDRPGHLLPDTARERPQPPRRPRAPRNARGQRVEHPAVRGLGRVGHRPGRTPPREHPTDQPRHHRVVGPAQRIVHLRARARGDRPRVGDPRRVVQQPRPALGDPLVAEREHDRGGAEGVGDDAGVQPYPLRAPPPGALQVVVERGHRPARRGDDQLDAGVEVGLDQGVHDLDELAHRGPVDVAGERHDGAVMEGLVRQHGLGSCDDLRGGTPARACRRGSRERERGPARSCGFSISPLLPIPGARPAWVWMGRPPRRWPASRPSAGRDAPALHDGGLGRRPGRAGGGPVSVSAGRPGRAGFPSPPPPHPRNKAGVGVDGPASPAMACLASIGRAGRPGPARWGSSGVGGGRPRRGGRGPRPCPPRAWPPAGPGSSGAGRARVPPPVRQRQGLASALQDGVAGLRGTGSPEGTRPREVVRAPAGPGSGGVGGCSACATGGRDASARPPPPRGSR